MTTKIIQLKRTKKNIYKDILNNPEKVRNILKKKKSNKNYQYLINPLIFNKNNCVINNSKSILNDSEKNINNELKPSSLEKKDNSIDYNKELKKPLVEKKCNLTDYTKLKKTENIKNKYQTNKIFIDFSKIKRNSFKKNSRNINKKKNSKKKYKKISDFFNSRENIRVKVIDFFKKIISFNDNNKIYFYLKKLNIRSLKILCLHMNLIRSSKLNIEKDFLINILYLSIADNIIIYKVN